jgi:glutamine---fructose-6-phosphate transaminase (isomerizing)
MNKFLIEIEEQPFALKETLSYYQKSIGIESLNKVIALWKTGRYDKILFTGMGSSYFISYAATCLFANVNNIPSFAINAGELLHYQPSLINSSTLLVCISQSGESFEIVKILDQLPLKITVIAICNEANSTLARKANVTLLSKAGKEEMTSTKTFISTYLVTYIMSLALVGKFNQAVISEIEKTIDIVSDLLKNREKWLEESVKTIAHAPFVQLVGRGPVFATVQQCALMLMEATRNPASALLGGEFRHGPMEMIKDGSRVVIFAPSGTTYVQSITATNDVLKFGAKVLLITDQTPSFENENLYTIEIPKVNEVLFVITSIIPMQLIVNQWSLEDKNEPGNFTRGAKITAIE